MKRLTAIICALLMYLPGTPWAMAQYSVVKHRGHYRQILFSRVLAGTFTGRFFAISGGNQVANTATEVLSPVLTAGNFRHLCFHFNSDPDSGGSSKGWTITLQKSSSPGFSSSPTAITVDVLSSDSGTSFSKCYTGADVHFGAGDYANYKITAAAGGAGANTPIGSSTIEFEADANDGRTLISTSSVATVLTTDSNYLNFSGVAGLTSTENTRMMVMPMDGTITSFLFYSSAAVTGSQTKTYTIRKTTGSGAGTTTSCTSNACGGTDTSIVYSVAGVVSGDQQVTENIPITAGDRINILQNSTGSPTLGNIAYGILFKPTTTGQFVIPMGFATASTSVATYISPSGHGTNSTSATEATVSEIFITGFSLNGFTMCATVSPGAGSYAVSLRENAGAAPTTYSTTANSGAYCPVTSASTSYAIPTNFNLYDSVITPASSPTASVFMVSYIGYIAP